MHIYIYRHTIPSLFSSSLMQKILYFDHPYHSISQTCILTYVLIFYWTFYLTSILSLHSPVSRVHGPPPTHQGGMDTWTHAYTQTQTNCIHLRINIHILHTYTYFMYIMYPSKTLIYRKRPWPSRGGGTTRCWATYIYIYTYLHTYLHTCIDACNRWLYIRIYIYIQSYTRLIRRLRK